LTCAVAVKIRVLVPARVKLERKECRPMMMSILALTGLQLSSAQLTVSLCW